MLAETNFSLRRCPHRQLVTLDDMISCITARFDGTMFKYPFVVPVREFQLPCVKGVGTAPGGD